MLLLSVQPIRFDAACRRSARACSNASGSINRTNSNEFRYRYFTVQQEGCTQKIGTDSMLLGAWAMSDDPMLTEPTKGRPSYSRPAPACRVLDIGTGTGVLALMIAQKSQYSAFHTLIDAIDVDLPSCHVARRNADASAWADRMRVMHISVQGLVDARCSAAGGSTLSAGLQPAAIEIATVSQIARTTEPAMMSLPTRSASTQCLTSMHVIPPAMHGRHCSTSPVETDGKGAMEDARAVSQASMHASMQGFGHDPWYDVIISNPPYFQDSTKPPAKDKSQRAGARHADVSLPFEELAASVAALLRPCSASHAQPWQGHTRLHSAAAAAAAAGLQPPQEDHIACQQAQDQCHGSEFMHARPQSAFYVVLPTDAAVRFEELARRFGLHMARLLRVKSRASDSEEKRRLMKFVLKPDSRAWPSQPVTAQNPVLGELEGHGEDVAWERSTTSQVTGDCGVTGAVPGPAGQAGGQQPHVTPLVDELIDETLVVGCDHVCDLTGRTTMMYTREYVALTADYHHPDHMVGKVK